MDGVVPFRVEIPTINMVRVPYKVYRRFQAAMESLSETAAYWYWQDPMKDARVAEGEAHPLVVTGLMALAQGHDLLPVIEKIESLGV